MVTRESVTTLFKTLRDRPTTKFERIFALFYLLVGLGILTLCVYSWINKGKPAVFLFFLAVIYLILWLSFWWQMRNERVCAQKMLDVLDAKNDDLCWIYIEEESGARESIQLHYRFTDRRHGTVIGTLASIDELLHFLATPISQLSTGWTEETAKRFRQDPHDLKLHPRTGWEHKLTVVPADNPSNGW